MRCPFCQQDNDHVVDTRPSDEGHIIRRRRECLDCKRRYTTHERLEDFPLRVVKKSGQRESFDRGKVLSGIMRALEKRPANNRQARAIVDMVENAVLERSNHEIKTAEIGEMVMAKLRALDEVAYVRFASVYREFKAVDEFVHEVHTMTAPEAYGG